MDISAMVEPTRRRGRPRKNSIQPQKTKVQKNKKEDIVEEDIILRMSVSTTDLVNKKVNGFELIQSECADVVSSDSSTSSENSYENDMDNLHRIIAEKEKHIAELEDKIESLESNKSCTKIVETINPSLKNIKICMFDCPFDKDNDGNLVIPSHTNEVCLWDMHEISGAPIFLPNKFMDSKFYVSSWFCSLNCALAYNLHLDDYNISERNSLLKWLYGKTECVIDPAPSYRVLRRFGGCLSIEEFRKNLVTNEKTYRIITPPMTFITQVLEEKMSQTKQVKKKETIIDVMRHKIKN